MNKRTKNSKRFLNSSLLIGIALLLIAVYLATFFFSPTMLNYKEQPYEELIEDKDFYNSSEMEGWHTIELGYFKVQTPVSYRFFRQKGLDSYVGGITNKIDTLYFDFGMYSNDFSEYDSFEDFYISNEILYGKKIKIVRALKSKGFIGAYTNDLKNNNTFSIYCKECQNIDEKLKIIKTIKFQ